MPSLQENRTIPETSIIMPAYNSAPFIREAIDSVLAQTYTKWELVIVDDASTDDTAQVVMSYHDERIRYKRNGQNMGAALTRNKAIAMAQGRYIAFLDADDLWLPEKLEKQIAFMQSKHIAISYTPYYILSEGDNTPIRSCPASLNYRQLTRWNRIGCLTVVYDREQIGDITLPDIRKRNDYALWLTITRKGFTAYRYNEPLARYRSHNGLTKGNKLAFLKYHYLLFRQVLHYPAIPAAFLALRNMPYYFIYRFVDMR